MGTERSMLEISGYYYDQEKCKYFKVQPSGSAPASSAYTVNDVKKRRFRDEKAAAERFDHSRHKARVKKSNLLRSTIVTGKLFTRQLGLPDLTDFARILANGFVNSGSVVIQNCHPINPLFSVQHRPDFGPSTVRVITAWNGLLCDTQVDAESLSPAAVHNDVLATTVSKHSHWRTHIDHLFDPTSTSLNRDSQLLAVTWLTPSSGAGIALTPLSDQYEWHSQVFGPGVTRGPNVDILSSTSAAAHSSLLFAFGSSHGILTLDKEASDLKWITPPKNNEFTFRDIFALEFHKENPSVLFSGGRRGQLHVLDLRDRRQFRSSQDFGHGGSITHIKQIDAHRVLVAGLKSSLCQYDLRHPKKTHRGHDFLRGNNVKQHGTWSTVPVLEYPDYRNHWNLRFGLDVDLESGIVATAQNQEGGVCSPVQLFSLHDGKVIQAPRVTAEAILRMSSSQEPIKCIQFERDCDQGVQSLYIGGRYITRFAWSTKDDDPL